MGRKISVSVSVDIDVLNRLKEQGYTPTEVFNEGLQKIEGKKK